MEREEIAKERRTLDEDYGKKVKHRNEKTHKENKGRE